ncbi:MAG: CoA transferase [Chloroflexi bacterium]|nr:CoA transferase [Chloroflexota bacterium]
MTASTSPEARLLSGIRVLDLSWYLAGPFCTKLLADYGADVVKVEAPGVGDPARRLGPFASDAPGDERGLTFAYLNANKRGITLDLHTTRGRAILMEMARQFDIVVESFAPGTMKSWGLRYEELARHRPGLVLTSITNFGQTGPYKDYKASHIVFCATGCWMHGLGNPEGPPLQSAGWISHYVIGATAAMATMAALLVRDATGRGQHVDISGQEAMVETVAYDIVDYTSTGQPRPRRSTQVVPGPTRCKDGWVGLQALSLRNWQRLCQLMDTEDLLQDPRLNTGQGRIEHAKMIRVRATEWAKDRTKQDIIHRGLEMGCTVATISTPQDVTELPVHRERRFLAQVEHPVIGKMVTPGYLFRVLENDQYRSPQWRPAPLLGQHNAEVFGEMLKYSPAGLTDLRQAGVI